MGQMFSRCLSGSQPRNTSRAAVIAGPPFPVVPPPIIAAPVPPAPPFAPPLPPRVLPNDQQRFEQLAQEEYLTNYGRRLLDEEAERLKAEDLQETGKENSLYATWHGHPGTANNVAQAAQARFRRHLRIAYPGLSDAVIARLAYRCVQCHYNLDGRSNYFA